MRPACVNASRWDCSLETASGSTGGFAIRLGLRMASGLREADGVRLVASRTEEPFTSVLDLQRRSGLSTGALVRLARADAFHALGLARRQALWDIRALRDAELPLFAAAAVAPRAKEDYNPDLRFDRDQGIRVTPRNFR